MQTNRKNLGLLIIILGLIILGLVIYFGFFSSKEEPEATPTENVPIVTGQLPTGGDSSDELPGEKPRKKVYDISQEPAHVTNENDVINMAKSFTERLGSFSNYSNYSNFSDLDIFMTQNMRDWAKDYVAGLRADVKQNETYYGITTTAITGTALEYDDTAGTAKISVSTQRQESTSENSAGKSYAQSIELTMKKVNGDWLVDKADWQTK